MISNCDLNSIEYLILLCKHLPAGRVPTQAEVVIAQKITEETMNLVRVEVAECNCAEHQETK